VTQIDLEAVLGTALEHYVAGRLAQSRHLYEAALAQETDARALAMLGVIAATTGEPGRAERLFAAAIALAPAAAEQHLNLGLLRRQGAQSGAVDAFRRAGHLAPGDARVTVALGEMGVLAGAKDSAPTALRRAIALAPGSPGSWVTLGQVRFNSAEPGGAAAAFGRAIAAQPPAIELLTTLAATRLRAGDLKGAWQAYERALMRRRASRWVDADLADGAGPPSGHPSFRETTRTKLGHDLQQLRYLVGLGLLAGDFERTVAAYESVLAEVGNLPLVALTAAQAQLLASSYNRVIYRRPPKPGNGPAINPHLDDADIIRRFTETRPGIVWVDDVLTPETLQELYRYCLESTVWFDYRHPAGYVGSMLDDGFNSPLLMQIADELPRRLPSLFGGAKLVQLWAFKYESGHAGTDLHADAARLNVNFWITPDEANLTPGRSGLEVWNRIAPADWDFAKFNNDQDAIRRFLEKTGAESIRIPYRCNRAAIFDSDLFHRTDDFRFRPGYANRRINVTLLYGDRGQRSAGA
jgi:tetratricopeptide (TPR) repeat protein